MLDDDALSAKDDAVLRAIIRSNRKLYDADDAVVENDNAVPPPPNGLEDINENAAATLAAMMAQEEESVLDWSHGTGDDDGKDIEDGNEEVGSGSDDGDGSSETSTSSDIESVGGNSTDPSLGGDKMDVANETDQLNGIAMNNGGKPIYGRFLIQPTYRRGIGNAVAEYNYGMIVALRNNLTRIHKDLRCARLDPTPCANIFRLPTFNKGKHSLRAVTLAVESGNLTEVIINMNTKSQQDRIFNGVISGNAGNLDYLIRRRIHEEEVALGIVQSSQQNKVKEGGNEFDEANLKKVNGNSNNNSNNNNNMSPPNQDHQQQEGEGEDEDHEKGRLVFRIKGGNVAGGNGNANGQQQGEVISVQGDVPLQAQQQQEPPQQHLQRRNIFKNKLFGGSSGSGSGNIAKNKNKSNTPENSKIIIKNYKEPDPPTPPTSTVSNEEIYKLHIAVHIRHGDVLGDRCVVHVYTDGHRSALADLLEEFPEVRFHGSGGGAKTTINEVVEQEPDNDEKEKGSIGTNNNANKSKSTISNSNNTTTTTTTTISGNNGAVDALHHLASADVLIGSKSGFTQVAAVIGSGGGWALKILPNVTWPTYHGIPNVIYVNEDFIVNHQPVREAGGSDKEKMKERGNGGNSGGSGDAVADGKLVESFKEGLQLMMMRYGESSHSFGNRTWLC
ncbi:hypothetical protein HDU76_006993 [Blyttiomyces sp. JEL0837]|nr:hypothetical protein HDU76_006993 [Blyttiomyces sp. JEL0837]